MPDSKHTVKPEIFHTFATLGMFSIVMFGDQFVEYFIPLNVSFCVYWQPLHDTVFISNRIRVLFTPFHLALFVVETR